MILPIGPLINALAIAVGALAGMALGSRLPERVRTIVFQGLGLCILVTGMQMAFVTKSPVILIFSVLLAAWRVNCCVWKNASWLWAIA